MSEETKVVLTIDGKVHSIDELEDIQKEYTYQQYDVRTVGWCSNCRSEIMPHFGEPFASCNCCDREWYY